MNNNAPVPALKALRNAQDIHALKCAIQALCEPSGPARSYQVVFNAKKRMVSCFLQMKSPLPDSAMQELDALGFGDVVRLEFPVGARFRASTPTPPDLPARERQSPALTAS